MKNNQNVITTTIGSDHVKAEDMSMIARRQRELHGEEVVINFDIKGELYTYDFQKDTLVQREKVS